VSGQSTLSRGNAFAAVGILTGINVEFCAPGTKVGVSGKLAKISLALRTEPVRT